MKSTEPDLIILRIGENVQDSLVVKRDLKKHINSLIDYFAAKNADVKVVIAGSFWKKDQVDATFKEVADYSGYAYLSLSFLSGDLSNTAYNRFTDLGIGSHPGDKGMSEIAGLIWSKIVEFSKK